MFGFSYESASRLADFLRNRVTFNFDTVVDMRSSIYVQEGMIVRTSGYYSVGDGGACTYTIRLRKSSDSDDGATKIFCGRQRRDSSYSQPFVAEPRIDAAYLDIRQFGLTSFIHSSIQMAAMSKCLTYCFNKGLYLCVHNKNFYDLAKTVQSGTVSLAGVKVQLKGMDMSTVQTMPVFHWEFTKGCVRYIKSTSSSSDCTAYIKDFDMHYTNYNIGTFDSMEHIDTSPDIVATADVGIPLRPNLGVTRCVSISNGSSNTFVVSATVQGGKASFIVYALDANKGLVRAEYNKVTVIDSGVESYMAPSLFNEGTESESLGFAYIGSSWTNRRTVTIKVENTSGIKYIAIGVMGVESPKLESFSINVPFVMDFNGGVSDSSVGVVGSFKMQMELEDRSAPSVLRTNGDVGEVIRFLPYSALDMGTISGSGTINVGWMKKAKTSSEDTWIVLKQDYQA